MPYTEPNLKLRHRYWQCLADDDGDISSEIDTWVRRYPNGRRWWCGSRALSGFEFISATQARRRLGDECDLLVFDARERFDPDAFGALSGTVVARGTLLLLINRPVQSGRFFRRLMGCLESPLSDGVNNLAEVPIVLPRGADPMARSADQALAITQLLRVAQGHRRRPLVLTADRGRGKSAAMGIATARLLQKSQAKVLVTAPRRDAVLALLGIAEQVLGEATSDGLVYVPPDELVRHPQKADLVLVDEAAAIPVSLLEQLLRRHARIAFATTTHGYEGTGRGFTIRFNRVLDRVTPQWRECRLQTPIRWAPGDPLERFTFGALLLDAEPADASSVADAASDNCLIERLNRDRLLDDERLLRELFGLLVIAHYQTRPSDLQRLLDDPAVSVWVARHDLHVVATALVAVEGRIDQALATEIAAGRRRLRGHLLPQTLAAHAGMAQAACLRYARVMRIAVHPAAQRRGLGHALLIKIRESALAESFDLWGTSFGATEELMRFWRNAGMALVRVGLKRDAASGMHSALWLDALNASAESILNTLQDDFFDGLSHLLIDDLQDLEPGLVQAALSGAPRTELTERDKDEVTRYVRSERDYAGVVAPLWRLVWHSGSAGTLTALTTAQRDALVLRVLQKLSWAKVASELDLPGKAQAEEILQDAVSALLSSLIVAFD